MNKTVLGVIFVIISAAGYGVLPIFVKFADLYMVNTNTLLFLRFGISAFLIFLYAFIRLGKISISLRQTLLLFFLGGVCYTLQSAFYFTSIKYIPISLAVLILFTSPALVSVLSFFINKDKLNLKVLASILLSFAGLAVVLGGFEGEVNYLGVITATGAAVVYAIYVVLGSRAVKDLQPVATSAFVTMFSAICILSAGLTTNSINFEFEAAAWWPILGIALFSTVVSILMFFKGIEILGSTRTSIVGMTEPVFAIVFSAVLFGDSFSVVQGIGGAAVLLGAVMVVLSGRRQEGVEIEV